MRLADAPRAGWYPDPGGGQRLRWWDGADWTDQYRARPSPAERARHDSGAAASARAAASVPGAAPTTPTPAALPQLDRIATEQIIAEVRQAARSEIDRAADVFTQRARAAVREVQPLVTQYTNQAFRWVRTAAVLALVLGIAWFTFQIIAQESFFNWLGDRIDNITDE